MSVDESPQSTDGTEQEIETELVPAPTPDHRYEWAADCPVCGKRSTGPYGVDARRNARNCCSAQPATGQNKTEKEE